LVTRRIKQEIEVNLPQFINANLTSLFKSHQQWQVIYQLTVIFPDRQQQWQLNFSDSEVTIKTGRNPLANYFVYITASTLYSLINRDRDWDYALCNGEYRTWHKVYALEKADLKYPQETSFSDPLELLFSSQYIAANNIYQELANYSRCNEPVLVNDSMLNLGNILIKKQKEVISN
ncbi:MAG: MBL fold metallo-hydrolase, partial [Cyanobacteria bacterium J06633_1]